MSESENSAIKEHNSNILEKFEDHLKKQKLSSKTIEKHLFNIDFYINDFLLYYDPIPAKDGITMVNSFLGDWFIRKAMWASVNTINQNATSLKKFYSFMYQEGEVLPEDVMQLNEDIKESKNEWIEKIKKYDDPNLDFEDIW